jgi:hypothetical protein
MKREIRTKQTKQNEPGVEKRSICAPREVFQKADAAMKGRMIESFSEYVRLLIREDLNKAA